MYYDEMTLELSESSSRSENDRRLGTFKVRILQSPAGEMAAGEEVRVEYNDKDLQSGLGKLDRRELDTSGVIALGRTLSAMLLPIDAKENRPTVRELFARSLEHVGPDRGLRLRLRLPGDLAVIPWEYAFVERAGGEGINGFLALDPRIAIVRHEVLASALATPLLTGDIKVVAAFAAAEGLPELSLDDEMKFLNKAISGLSGIQLELCQHATLHKLQPLLPGAGVFHFSGHGDFRREMGAKPGTYTGIGYLAFEDERLGAEQMGINLRGNGVRLAVLSGCHTGRRDGVSVWSGIAPALVKAEVPAVVANQYTIRDKCAIAFTRQFYQALAGGLPIERAVSAGRISAYNADKEGRDWGVPVLYLRAADGQLFAGAADSRAREQSKQAAEADVKLRTAEVRAGAVLIGADVRRIVDGKLAVAVGVDGTVLGDVEGFKAGQFEGGSVLVQVDVNEVGSGGKVVGFRVESFGKGAERRPQHSKKASAPEKRDARGKTHATPPTSTTTVKVEKAKGGQVIGTQINHRDTGIGGENVQIGSVTIYQGTNAESGKTAGAGSDKHVIEERLRLDVALPKRTVVDEPFDIVIAVMQPGAPPLSITDLDQLISAGGSIFRTNEREIVRYKVEVIGAGFEVSPPSYSLELRPGANSRPITFQVISAKTGKRSLLVNAYQEDGALCAQTKLTIEVTVSITAN
jgi:hypothetical protein